MPAVLARDGLSLLLGAGNQGWKSTRREGGKRHSSSLRSCNRLGAALLSSLAAPGRWSLPRELEVLPLAAVGFGGLLLVRPGSPVWLLRPPLQLGNMRSSRGPVSAAWPQPRLLCQRR